MKIGMVTNKWLPHIGGIELYTYQIAKKLIEKSHEVKIITSTLKNSPREEVIEGIDVTRLASFNLLDKIGIPYPLFYPNITKKMKNFVKNCDIIHGHGHPYISSFLAGKYSKKDNKPFVLTIHNSFIDYHNILINSMEKINDLIISKRTLNYSNIVISTCHYIEDYIKTVHPINNSKVLYNGIDEKFFFPVDISKKTELRVKLNLPPDKLICLTVGRITFKKGINLLVKVAKKFREGDVIFLIVGTGPDFPKLKRLIKKNKLENKIFLTGFVSDELLTLYYQVSDIFILPSESGEALTSVIPEAFLSKLPVISTKSGGQIEIVKNGETGYLANNNDIESIVKYINILKKDPNLRDYLGHNGMKVVKEKMSWKNHIDTLISIYEESIMLREKTSREG